MKYSNFVLILLFLIFIESAFSRVAASSDEQDYGVPIKETPGSAVLAEPMMLDGKNSILATDDHENVDKVGRWPTSGECWAVDVSGTIAYFGNGSYLEIIDFSDPSHPIELGRTLLPETMKGIDVSGSYAFVADNRSGLRIVNVSNPVSPFEVGFYDTQQDALDVAVSGNYAYVADNSDGLRVINISNPASPFETGFYDTNGYSLGVAVRGSYAYVADGRNGFCVINVSNPASPILAGWHDTEDCCNDVVLNGNYAFVTDWWPGVRVIDISNPASPFEAGFFDTDAEARGLAMNGNHVYVADRLGGLRVIDFSNPASPFEAGFYDTGDIAHNVSVNGNYAYVADIADGLWVLRFPALETISYTFTQPGWYMVSLPVMPTDDRVSELFPNAMGGMAFTWNAQGGAYDIVTTMETKKGYWLAITEAGSVNVAGEPMDDYSIHFASPGWYMIGGGLGSTNFSNPNDSPDGQVMTPMFEWDPSSGAYAQSTTMDEMRGYWVAILGECDLSIGGIGLPKTLSNSNFASLNSGFGSNPPPPPTVNWETGIAMEKPAMNFQFQNYPNPFNSETTFNYFLPEYEQVSLNIYNSNGQLIRNVVHGGQGPGYCRVAWDGKDDYGSNLGSGLYFARISIGNRTVVQKLMMVK